MCITVHQYDSHMLSIVEVRVCVCVRLHKWCTFGTHIQRSDYMHTHQSLRGHGVGMVGSSWTGNIHPTPAIELLQGKRGDHGCMAKAGFVSLASSLIFSYVYAHCRVAGEGCVCIFSRFMYSIACLTLVACQPSCDRHAFSSALADPCSPTTPPTSRDWTLSSGGSRSRHRSGSI